MLCQVWVVAILTIIIMLASLRTFLKEDVSKLLFFRSLKEDIRG